MSKRRLTDIEADLARLITKAKHGGIITQSQRVHIYRMIKTEGLQAARITLIRAIDMNKARNF